MLRSREHPPSNLRRTAEATYIGNDDIEVGVLASAVLRLPSLLCAAFCSSSRGGGIVDNKKAETKASAEHLVAPTGFEPATFALRGRRPKPLDDGAIKRIYQNGWGGRSRTLTYGTRNRCPAIRRHPSGKSSAPFPSIYFGGPGARRYITHLPLFRQHFLATFLKIFPRSGAVTRISPGQALNLQLLPQ